MICCKNDIEDSFSDSPTDRVTITLFAPRFAVIPGQMHPQHVSVPVGLTADAAGVREAFNVSLHVLFELALVVSELACTLGRSTPHCY